MRGQPQEHLLAGCPRVPGSTLGRLYALRAGYPALQPGGKDRVHGELVTLPDDARLPILDRYEGVDEGLYRRIEVGVETPAGVVRAQAYVMDDPERRGGRLLPAGRWRRTIRR